MRMKFNAARKQLQGAVRELEISIKEQKAINEEASSLNEGLKALNGQLQEALKRQKSTTDDMQNILYSTNIATMFLDLNLNIRFYTPATNSLFNIIPSDVGRPLTEFESRSADTALVADARAVLLDLAPIEREIETLAGIWIMRRISPYLTHGDNLQGVFITFTDISDRTRIRKDMLAKLHGECTCQAQAHGPSLHVVAGNYRFQCDQRLLKQTISTGLRQTPTVHIAGLTARQRQIMGMVLDGHPSKNIAADLNISQRTVENHRASIMKRTGAKSLPGLARLALAANPNTASTPL